MESRRRIMETLEPLEPLITNDRGKREWEYIVSRVGEERAQQ